VRTAAPRKTGLSTADALSAASAPLVIVLGALALTAALYWPTSLEIADLWEDTVRRRYTHGWLVLAVTVWMVWRDRAQLRSLPLTPPPFGWVVVAAGSLGWLVGFNAGLLAVTTLAMPLLVLATIWAAGGLQLARRAAFAVLFLYFALPVWELINPLLQSMTAWVNLWLARLVGIPVTMNEYVIHIPAGSFEIAGGCSGLHFLIVALAIAALQGEIDGQDWRRRWLLLGMAAALALVTNWLRVFIIIVAGHLTNMQHFLVRVNHYYFGWFLFAFTLALYLYLASRVPPGGRAEQPPTPQSFATPRSRAAAAMILPAAALALGPAWSLAETGGAGPPMEQSPPSLDGWSGPEIYLSDWHPVFENADDEFLAAYYRESVGEVALYRAVYRSQRQGKELRGQRNSTVGAGYRVQASGERKVPAVGGDVSVLEQLVVGADGRELLVWSLFAVDGRPDPMRFPSQVAYGIRSMLRAPTASVIALAAECRPDCARARSALGGFSTQALPAVLSSLQQGHADPTEIRGQ
jgi:exosortase A